MLLVIIGIVVGSVVDLVDVGDVDLCGENRFYGGLELFVSVVFLVVLVFRLVMFIDS